MSERLTSTVEVENPGSVMVRMTFTMDLDDWGLLVDALNASDKRLSFPARQFIDEISDLRRDINKQLSKVSDD